MSQTDKSGNPAHMIDIRFTAGEVELEGYLGIPENAAGIVLFAHGSGSGRNSPRNQFVAREIQRKGIGAFLFDLLTPYEEQEEMFTRHLRFNIELLAERLAGATEWVMQDARTKGFPLGYFGASTGAAAALIAATHYPQAVRAIVSRGGRPDLAGPFLRRVTTPTLFIVGGKDAQVIEMNRSALDDLAGEKELVIVPGATHLFEEPGTLESAASLAADWFTKHLAAVSTS